MQLWDKQQFPTPPTQPRCAEPWVECVFADDTDGKVQVIVSPLVRLTNKPSAKITEIGTPEGVLESLGPFITGTYLDQEDVVSVGRKEVDGRVYYTYEVGETNNCASCHVLS